MAGEKYKVDFGSKKFLRRINAHYSKKGDLPKWILDYARTPIVQDMLGMNRMEIKTWFVFHFTNEFGGPYGLVRQGPFIEIERKYGDMDYVPLIGFVPDEIDPSVYEWELWNHLQKKFPKYSEKDLVLFYDFYQGQIFSTQEPIDIGLEPENAVPSLLPKGGSMSPVYSGSELPSQLF